MNDIDVRLELDVLGHIEMARVLKNHAKKIDDLAGTLLIASDANLITIKLIREQAHLLFLHFQRQEVVGRKALIDWREYDGE